MDTLDLSNKVYQLLVQGWQFSLASSTKSDRRDITENLKTSFKQILTWNRLYYVDRLNDKVYPLLTQGRHATLPPQYTNGKKFL
jgi:hypothetical protein